MLDLQTGKTQVGPLRVTRLKRSLIIRWIKPVSTLSKDRVIRRIDTLTLYHSTTIVCYHIKHQLSLKKIWLFSEVNIYHGNRKPCKNTIYFNFSRSYLKKELGNRHFLFLKCDQHARMKLSAKLKNLRHKLKATLNKWNFAESVILACCMITAVQWKFGSPSSFFRYECS